MNALIHYIRETREWTPTIQRGPFALKIHHQVTITTSRTGSLNFPTPSLKNWSLSYNAVWIYHLSESCPEFGSSGSGIVREWAQRNDKKAFSIDNGGSFSLAELKTVDTYQYSFVGPLSMQKGCDNAFHMYTRTIASIGDTQPNNGISFETNKLSYRGMYVYMSSKTM